MKSGELKVVYYLFNGAVMPIFGAMACNCKILVISTPVSVWTFDGKAWICIGKPYKDA